MSLLLCVSTRSANYASLVTAQLIVMASHMVVFLLSVFNLEFSLLALFIFTHLSNYLFYVIMEAGLGLPDTDAWYMIETIAEKNSIGFKQFVSTILVSLIMLKIMK